MRRTTRSAETGALAATKPVLPPSPWYVVQPDGAGDAGADGGGGAPVVGEEVDADEGDDDAGDGDAVPLQAAVPSVAAASRPAMALTPSVSGPAPALSLPVPSGPRRAIGDTGRVIGLDLALSLRTAGLRWTPSLGDRFVLPNRGMDEDVFVLSNMTVEVHEFPTGKVIGFNGVTEWALDSIDQQEAVWLPAEHQLRELLGGLFVRLASGPAGFEVTLHLPSGRTTHREVTGSLAEPTVR
jgi:hypothetical protein